jgi:DNA mismatch repair protein MutS
VTLVAGSDPPALQSSGGSTLQDPGPAVLDRSGTPTPQDPGAGVPESYGAPTPLMRQYARVKRAHRDAILIFRLGDFYEMFFEDAELGAAALDLTLTSRNNGKARRVPLAGFPVKAAETYIGRLIAAGYKVAICEQMEDPRVAKGIVQREVVQVVTPGALVDEALLDGDRSNFLAALALQEGCLGMAFADVSTGELWLEEAALEEAAGELERMAPAELLLPSSWCEGVAGMRPTLGEAAGSHSALAALCRKTEGHDSQTLTALPLTLRDDGWFDPSSAREKLLRHLGVVTLAGFGIPDGSPAVSAAGAALAYLTEVQPLAVATLKSPRWLKQDEVLLLDDATLRNLEVFRTLRDPAARDGGARDTLQGAIDGTLTAPGARLLRSWLSRPLNTLAPIVERHQAVGFLYDRGEVRARIRTTLRLIPDVPRIAGRAVAGRVMPRELSALARGLSRLPELREALPEQGLTPLPTLLTRLILEMDDFSSLQAELERALVDDPPPALGEGEVVRQGYDADLDALRDTRRSGIEWIAALQQRERQRTGIGSLKVGFNRVFGYFIEITRANLAQVPADYLRKQTIANAERFFTPELKDMEARVLGAEEKIGTREAELYAELREHVARRVVDLQRLGEALATLDVLAAFGEIAAERGYCCPEMLPDETLEIRAGRHPVVEVIQGLNRFVPNDIGLDAERRIMILTGPNMAGKSTYLRQVGLIALLAHAGSWVPAESARIGLADRIFTRVGAADDLAHGRSTFLVEMVETANILRNCSSRSLVLMDEVGRGTATFDGLSLAWAVTERLHALQGGAPRTIFATHYHELTELATILSGVFNAHAQVKEWGEEIVFLKTVAEGKSDRSYGIQVARIAGMPEGVVERAREILANLEAGEFGVEGLPRRSQGERAPASTPDQISIFEWAADPLRDELRRLEVEGLRPLEALNLLAQWKERYGR